ncbi:type II secretion system F family protein [Halalkalirubrum salinum]|uniref:type II secretion system F family protein n=1 Tax=Halalkalirubrum salinum TaxID=2563889 RepID=UPI0010FB1F7A|nr:type II secretion system F family protein [Halalkalirubrum salinum]
MGTIPEFGDSNPDSDPLSDLFYPVFKLIFDQDGDFLGDIDRKLTEARMSAPVELYVSRSLGIGIILGGLLWVVGTLVGYGLFRFGILSAESLSLGIPVSSPVMIELLRSLVIPSAIGLSGLVFGTLGFATGFGSMLAVPYSKADSRKREINMLLPDAVAFMYALSVGGLNQLEIIESMAVAEDTYGEVSREFQSIVAETEYFGTDYRNAIRQQAIETPSSDLSQFLTDMLSIINSGGDMEPFLDDKKDAHMRTAKQQQELTLETLELFGEMYMTLSLFPLLLVIILVIMGMMGDADEALLYGTIYALVPLVGAGFLVLISTVKQDEPGNGYLGATGGSDRLQETTKEGLRHLGLVERFVGSRRVFNRIKSREGTYKTMQILKRPHLFFRDNPWFTLAFTVPPTLVLLIIAVTSGRAPLAYEDWIAQPIWSTVIWVYVPLYLVLTPLGIFYEWNVRSRHAVTGKLSGMLRKLSSANDTGQTLLESIYTVADTSSGKLADEFDIIYMKVNYGVGLRDALVEFNNKYHIPRLARTVKLITEAQEASSQITDVLSTAAQASENQDDIERERISRTRMQVAIIIMTYFTLLAVMAILQTQFIDVMGGIASEGQNAELGGVSGGPNFGGGFDPAMLSLLFFHAVTIQAVLSGLICGYIRNATLISGVKFVVALATVALATWVVVA